MKDYEVKVYKNALIGEKLTKLEKEERKKIVIRLLSKTGMSEGALSEELGIPKSTLHDWKSGRQRNVGKDIHISFNTFYRKISSVNIEDITDWGRLEQIHRIIGRLLNEKEKTRS